MSKPLGYLPNHQQELLLKAALFGDVQAAEAWKSWRAHNQLEVIDSASFRLLPLVYVNLNKHGYQDSSTPKLKGIYRRSWLKNRLLFHQARRILKMLHEVGTQSMLLKGLALALEYYGDFGARTMDDVDVLIQAPYALRAIEFLDERGWDTNFPRHKARIPLSHAIVYRHPDGLDFDLHWHLLEECCRPGDDDSFWERAVEVELDGIQATVLSPADQLLHTLVHGARWKAIAPIRWVADAAYVLKKSINWEHLVDEACQRRLVLPVRDTLTYLVNTFEATVPTSVLRQLESEGIPLGDRIEYGSKVSPENYTRRLVFHWFNHIRIASYPPFARALIAFPNYLLRRWGVESVWKLPEHIISEQKRRSEEVVAHTP